MARHAGWRVAAAAVAVLGGAARARADVYMVRDATGAVVLTNVPAETEASTAERVLEEAAPVEEFAIAYTPAWRASYQPQPDDGRYDELIREVALDHDMEFALVKAVIRTESSFDPFAISHKGAQGLMQLMPATARLHGVREVFRPRDNVEGGVRHLRMLIDRYGGNVPLALAAYNAGTGRVEAAGGIPAISETRDYVVKVLRYRKQYLQEEGGGVLQARR